MNQRLEQQASEVFFAVIDLPPDDREHRLASVPDDPPGLLAWVRALLAAANANRDGFLERPAAGTNFSVSRAIVPQPHPHITENTPPDVIGPYRVIRPIAERDFTSVYLCQQDAPIRRTAAVKVLHSLLHRRELLKRFEGERQMIASLQHPNIAQFYEAGETESGIVYFSMEFIDGPTVSDSCQERVLPLRERLELFLQICAAVEHAHQRGIIHRDLKPANILVQPDDGTGHSRVKVIDFGVAKALNADAHPTATVTGQLIGTFAYMSPEQFSGRPENVDTRADVFALGLVLFEMLAGRVARQSFAVPQTTSAPATDSAWAFSVNDSTIPDDLARIVGKASSFDRDARYGTVAALREDVERFLTNRPISARPTGIIYRTRKFIRRNRLVTATFALLALSAAVTVGVVWRARTQRLDLAVQLAEAWFEETRVMQSTIGEASLRGPALKRLSAQVAAFSQIAPEDPRVRAMQASSLTELGYAALDANDSDTADRSFREAFKLRQDLAHDSPGDIDCQMQLSLALVRVGDAAGSRGDSATRLEWSLQALRIDERVLEEHPTNPRALSNLGWSYDRLGNIALQRGDTQNAASYKTKALGVFDRYTQIARCAEAFRGRATANLSLAEIHDQLGDLQLAAEHADLAHRDAKIAAEIAPSDRFVLQVLVYSEFRHADCSMRAGKASLSLETTLNAVKHAEVLLSITPGDQSTHRLLAHALLNASRRAIVLEQRELGCSLAKRAQVEYEKSVRDKPIDSHYLQMTAECRELIKSCDTADEALGSSISRPSASQP